jgi:LPS O-antigen subunit length determinant protein (WzzB/FepE family)
VNENNNLEQSFWRSLLSLKMTDLQALIRQEKWTAIGTFFAVLLAALAYLMVMPPQYTAQLILAPSEAANAGSSVGLGNLLGSNSLSLGASILNGASSGNRRFDDFLELLKSERVATRMEAQNHVMREVFHKRWDSEAGDWKPPSPIIGPIKQWFLEILHRERVNYPTVHDFYIYLNDNVTIARVKDTELRQLSYQDEDPADAKRFLLQLFHAADDIAKADQVAVSRSYLSYLQTQLEKTTLVEQRTAISNLISEQLKLLMFAQADVPFVAKIYFGPTAPDSPDVPSLPLTAIVAVVMGFVLSLVAVLLRGWARFKRDVRMRTE